MTEIALEKLYETNSRKDIQKTEHQQFLHICV